MHAAESCRADCVRLLLDAGADKEVKEVWVRRRAAASAFSRVYVYVWFFMEWSWCMEFFDFVL
jgi:hypothetical protein